MGELRFEPPVGQRISHPFYEEREDGGKHHGIDFESPEDTEVRASEGGVVRRAAFNPDNPSSEAKKSYGEVIVIDHTPNAGPDEKHIYTLYAHLKSNTYTTNVKPEGEVKKGEVIALSANTGTAEWFYHKEHGKYKNEKKKGMHLHFEVLESPGEIKWNKTENMGVDRGLYRKKPDSYFGEDTIIDGTLAGLDLNNLTDKQLRQLSACVECVPVMNPGGKTCHVDWYVAGAKKGTTDQYNKEIDLLLNGEEVERILKNPARYVAKRSGDLTYDVKV